MRYVIGIGSNMGDSVSIVRRAIDEIEAMFYVDVDERSSLYRTRPMGGPEQDDYINAVVVIRGPESAHLVQTNHLKPGSMPRQGG